MVGVGGLLRHSLAPLCALSAKSEEQAFLIQTVTHSFLKMSGAGGEHSSKSRNFAYRLAASSPTIKYMAAKPASSTPLSSVTEIRCKRPNSASSGLSAAVAWIDP